MIFCVLRAIKIEEEFEHIESDLSRLRLIEFLETFHEHFAQFNF